MAEDKTEAKKQNWAERHKVWSVLITLFIVGSIISAVKSPDPVSPPAATSATSTAQATTAPVTPKTEYKIGEAATVDDRTVTVTGLQRNYSTGNEYLKPEAGKEFVVATVQITNNGKDAVSYNTYDFKMQDSNGVQLTETYVGTVDGQLNSGSLAPGGKVVGRVTYQVPAGDKGLKLLFQNVSLFNNTVITFAL